MSKSSIKIVWLPEAKEDLKYIRSRVFRKTKSKVNTDNVINDIIIASKSIHFVDQYQYDEFLKEPYRRIVVKHFKIIYKAVNNSEIRIFEVFDTYQNPSRLRKDN